MKKDDLENELYNIVNCKKEILKSGVGSDAYKALKLIILDYYRNELLFGNVNKEAVHAICTCILHEYTLNYDIELIPTKITNKLDSLEKQARQHMYLEIERIKLLFAKDVKDTILQESSEKYTKLNLIVTLLNYYKNIYKKLTIQKTNSEEKLLKAIFGK